MYAFPLMCKPLNANGFHFGCLSYFPIPFAIHSPEWSKAWEILYSILWVWDYVCFSIHECQSAAGRVYSTTCNIGDTLYYKLPMGFLSSLLVLLCILIQPPCPVIVTWYLKVDDMTASWDLSSSRYSAVFSLLSTGSTCSILVLIIFSS